MDRELFFLAMGVLKKVLLFRDLKIATCLI